MTTKLSTTASPSLKNELNELNERQRDAVVHTGSLVVLAGPGSGKTRTLAAKVAYLLEHSIGKRQAVAAMTYTRHASREIVDRVRRLGLEPGTRLVCNTVHGWCLSAILRPYGPLTGIGSPDNGKLIDDDSDEWIGLLQICFDDVGLTNDPKWEKAKINKLRREISAGLIPEDGNNPMVRASRLFDERMLANGWWDFDAMVARSLQIVKSSPTIGRLVAAKFPWIVIDEYQDLGPVLHALVLGLQQTTPLSVVAFGDPDQTMMEFTGADPRFLRELSEKDGFEPLELQVNYRCGRAIIAASHTALDSARDHQPDPNRVDDGVVEPIEIDGGLDAHAATMIDKIRELSEGGVPLHDIAVLYPTKGPMLDAIKQALHQSRCDYHHERDERIPTGQLADFLRDCATRAVAGPQPAGYDRVHNNEVIPTINQLVYDYLDLCRAAGLDPGRRVAQRKLMGVIGNQNADVRLDTWLTHTTRELRLDEISYIGNDYRNSIALAAYREAGSRHCLTLGDIAAGTIRTEKVTLTTYHSAKGREWPVVILPGLVDGMLPRRRPDWPNRAILRPSDTFQQDRRLFYVGMTRAKSAVILIYGHEWSSKGYRYKAGISPFANDVLTHLDLGADSHLPQKDPW
ncbi:ATP-dependent helicase [Nocardia gipuzkoensis]